MTYRKLSVNEADRPHDYDPQWDYENPVGMKRNPDYNQDVWKKTKKFRELAGIAVKRIQAEILPQLPSIQQMEVYFVSGEIPGGVAQYINGTKTWPVIILDSEETMKVANELEPPMSDSEIITGIGMSIVHELGHAIQDIFDMEPDEDQAEEFAREAWDYGTVARWARE